MSLIVVPYETRVLGPISYGLLGVTSAIMVYFQLIIDFGFLLSATEEVSFNQDNKKYLSKVFTSVTIIKLILSGISFVILMILCYFIKAWRGNMPFFFLSFISTILASLMPDYMYRGLEKMSAITMRSVLIKVFFTVMVFVCVKRPEDIVFIPVLNIVGNLLALFFVYVHLFLKLNIKFTFCSLEDLKKRFKTSSMFFLSRIATTVYTAANTIILDLLSAGAMTAYYTSADKIVSTAKGGMSPISDSLYPYMVRHRDFKIVRKILLVLEPVIIAGCTLVFIYARPLCIWFFGNEYEATALILRALLPVVAIVLPSYIFGFPMLGAMGLNRYANYSILFGSCIHVCNLLVLYLFGYMNMVTLGIATSITEALILIYRVVVVIRYKRRYLHQGGKKTDDIYEVEETG